MLYLHAFRGWRASQGLCPSSTAAADLDLSGLHQHLERANQAIGRLDGLTFLLHDVRFLLYLYVRKEALVSSQIEGTQSSFVDVLLLENKAPTAVPKEDVEEVSNYVAARGLERIKRFVSVSSQLSSGHTLHVVNIGF